MSCVVIEQDSHFPIDDRNINRLLTESIELKVGGSRGMNICLKVCWDIADAEFKWVTDIPNIVSIKIELVRVGIVGTIV